ncbi:MAG: hypothetical protein ACRED5_02690 [Propylenella sp.]
MAQNPASRQASDFVDDGYERLDGYFETIAQKLPAGLVTRDALATLTRQFGALPAALTGYFGFECRLADGDSQTDFQFVVRSGSRGQALLAGEDSELRLPDSWRRHPHWQQVTEFARAWRLMPPGHIPHIWLGFDCGSSETSVPLPLMHLRTDKRSLGEILHLVRDAAGRELPPMTVGTLRTCLEEATATYVGFMFSRSENVIRITQPLLGSAALSYLDAIAWPGDRRQVVGLLETIGRWTTHVGLSLNLESACGPYLGLEILNWTKPASDRATWRACLEWLTRQGLCTADKSVALMNWPRLVHSRSPHWSGLLRGKPAEGGDGVLRVLTCNLSHVKLVCRPGEPLEAKAYIDVGHSVWKFESEAVRPLEVS